MSDHIEGLRRFDIPGTIRTEEGTGGLPRVKVTTPWSAAEIYLHGAQVTAFQKHNEPPLLFLSGASPFAPGKAIRGGVPICFPWFGSRPGEVAHGFARITDWDLAETRALANDAAVVRLTLPRTDAARQWLAFATEFVVTVSHHLEMVLAVTNKSATEHLVFENCLHSYFAVGNISEVTVSGLESTPYLDKTADDALRPATGKPIRITAQTDRTYLDTTSAVEILDPVLSRTIRIEKSGSMSTVVWNPWTTQPLADLGAGQYRQMICVESGNVERNRVSLGPGQTASLKVVVTS